MLLTYKFLSSIPRYNLLPYLYFLYRKYTLYYITHQIFFCQNIFVYELKKPYLYYVNLDRRLIKQLKESKAGWLLLFNYPIKQPTSDSFIHLIVRPSWASTKGTTPIHVHTNCDTTKIQQKNL